jgi:hypothetical protein
MKKNKAQGKPFYFATQVKDKPIGYSFFTRDGKPITKDRYAELMSKYKKEISKKIIKKMKGGERMTEKNRIKVILKALPLIRTIIRNGGKWEAIKYLCEPLGLTNTAFRDNPSLKDYLVSYKYWRKRLNVSQTDTKEEDYVVSKKTKQV